MPSTQPMDELEPLRRTVAPVFEAVRKACSATAWDRGGNLSRGGRLTARSVGPDELEVRIVTAGGALTPPMRVSPEHRDWTCDCPSTEDKCAHMAAVLLLLSTDPRMPGTVARGPRRSTKGARLSYVLVRTDGGLCLRGVLHQGGKRSPVTMPLAAIKKRLHPEPLNETQLDVIVDRLLHGRVGRPILRPVMAPLLEALGESETITLDGDPVRIGPPRPVRTIHVESAEGGGYRVESREREGIAELFANGAALSDDGELFAEEPLNLSENDRAALRRGRVYGPSEVHTLISKVLPALKAAAEVKVHPKRMPRLRPIAPDVHFLCEHRDGRVVVTPSLVYGDPPSARVEDDRVVHLGGPLPARDPAAEKALAERLWDELRLVPGRPSEVTGEEAVGMAKGVLAFGGQIEGDGLEACFVAGALEADLVIEEDRASLVFTSEHDGETRTASPKAILDAWRRGSERVALDDGGWAPLPSDFLQKHGHLVADLLSASDENGELPRSSGPDVVRLAKVLGRPPPPDFLSLRALADGFDGVPEAPLPEGLKGELRTYQKRAADWLAFLSSCDLGALLADDMGLGKTLQAITVLGSPTLVVCPSSVLHAWQQEIARFRPGLTVARYHGLDRALDEDVDVTLTTYAILRRDADALAAKKWDTVILDEAQYIKNPTSQVAQAAYGLEGRFRMALTGTPVENRLEDLWSIMHFLNPGLLGGLVDFRERYARPVADGDKETAERLRARVRPFVTRRLKSEVAPELPPRTDVVLHCTLSDEERAAYDAVRAATHEEVVRELQAGRGVLAALEALLRLRQAACHRGLLPGHEAETSSKLELLFTTLEEIMDEGHRALVFSQWTSLLDRVEPHLTARGVEFVRLDGSTRDRAAVVERFQSEDGPPVMLISLKAGGVGLTLTRADHVFLLDPWWNPAVEDQAADRIHRIGQEHPVLVHRLVAEDTVEERLLALQEHKRTLAATALGTGEVGKGVSAGISRDDLLALLA